MSALAVDVAAHSLKCDVEDLYANFANPDLAEYPGCRPATLIFDKLSDLLIDLDIDEGLRISDARIVSEAQKYRLNIWLNIGYGSATNGPPKITATFKSLHVKEGPCAGRDP